MIHLTHYRTASTTATELLDDITFPQQVHWFPETYNKVGTGMFYSPHRLAEKVLDPELVTFLRENPVGKTAFILAAGNAHFAGINPRKTNTTRLSYEYKFLPFTLTQVYAGRLAQSMGATDHIVTDSTACASSMKALMDVQTLIRFYNFNRVIVLSLEDAVTNAVLEFFGESQACLTKKEEDLGVKPSAFDSQNHGFHVGQGAVLAVFEDARTAWVGPKRPEASLLGAYTAAETCPNAIGQREDGEGFIKAIYGAFEMSRASSSDVRIVKTHGTGTISNNKAEKAALETLPNDFVATSYKAKIGHTMGASGLLETCLLLDDLKRGVVPKIENRTEHDDRFLSHDESNPGGLILSLAAGMGNVYSAAILSTEI
jgi:3-oxoacyl-(acyl-carrier-protein) synthase